MNLFHKRWQYVDFAELSSEEMTFRFNQNAQTQGPFHLKVGIKDTISDTRFSWGDESFSTRDRLVIGLTDVGPLDDYSVSLSIDGHVAFAGRHQDQDALPW